MAADRAPGSFLAVEDDHDVQRGIAGALDGGLQVRFAGSGEEGLQHLATGPLPRFVLLDDRLPGLSGVEVLRRLRADPRTRHLPVVLFSSRRDAARVREALEAGANSWVAKPDDPRAFAACVQALCRYWGHLHVTP